ncbi:MAG TPA: TlpA disulfide reductase family protein [Bacteroidia bacterium]|nr:TlpA disulfide reductase family protein [Bacteroidia bacterium]
MLRKGFLLLVLFLSVLSLPAENLKEYDFSFKVKGLKEGDTTMIAYYLGTKQYIKDTLVVPKSGIVNFKGTDLEGGIFLFVVPGMKYFEFLAVEPKISLETDLANMVSGMKVKLSEENTVFFDYLKFIETRQKQSEALKAEKENPATVQTRKDEIDKAMQALDKEVKAYRDKVIADNKGKFVSKLLYASLEPEVPVAPEGMSAEEAKMFQFRKYKSEYLKYVDFSDDRMLRTPIIQNKIKEYLNRLTVQHPDSIIMSVEDIMLKAQANKDVFKFCVITITNMWSASKQMCFDKIYVHMAGSYYVSGRADWIDSTQLSKIKDRYYKMLYNNCGCKAANLVMNDFNDKQTSLYNVDAKYTVLVFWAHDCGHCKKEMPQLAEFLKEYKQYGVKVFAVSTKEEIDKWKAFVKEKGMEDFINVADPENKTNFRIFYDIYSTPVIYLLDKDKMIMAKRLDLYNLKKYLNHELGLPEPPAPDPSEKHDEGDEGH